MPRRGYAFPLALIGIGVFAFLVNAGALPSSAWRDLLRVWPVVLILIGSDLLLAPRSPLLALVVDAAIVVLALGFVVSMPRLGAAGAPLVTVPRDAVRVLELRVAMGGGTLSLRGGGTELVEASSTESDLGSRVERRGDRAVVRLEQPDRAFIGHAPTEWNVRVASDLPLELNVAAGAGDFTLDLAEVRATDVRVATGAANLRLVLPRPSGEVAVRVSSGASSIAVEIPSGVEARVSTSGALISVLGRTETLGYASARDRVTVTINAGASSVTIR